MRRIRSQRGKPPIITANMPDKYSWNSSVFFMTTHSDGKYYSTYDGRYYQLNDLYDVVNHALISADLARRQWGERVLKFFNLPVE